MAIARYGVYLSVNKNDRAALAALSKLGYTQVDIFRIGLKTLLLKEAQHENDRSKDSKTSK